MDLVLGGGQAAEQRGGKMRSLIYYRSNRAVVTAMTIALAMVVVGLFYVVRSDGSGWYGWRELSIADHTHANIVPVAEDVNDESYAITDYPAGISIMPANNATANWPSLGGDAQDKLVTTNRKGTTGWQEIRETDAFSMAGHTHLIADLPVADDAESTANEVVRSNDSRLSNARTPVQATETAVGGGELATQAETNTGTDDTRIVTPLKLRTSADARYVQLGDYENTDVLAKVATALVVPVIYFEGDTLAATASLDDVGRFPVTTRMAGIITEIRAALTVTSTSDNVVAVVKKNGSTTIATLTVIAGQNAASATGLSTALAAGDYVTVEITSAGTGAKHLTIAGELSRAA